MDGLALAATVLILTAVYAGHVKLATFLMGRIRLDGLETFKLGALILFMSLALPTASMMGQGALVTVVTIVVAVLFHLLIGAMFLRARAKTAEAIPLGFLGGIRVMAVILLLLAATGAILWHFSAEIAPPNIVVW